MSNTKEVDPVGENKQSTKDKNEIAAEVLIKKAFGTVAPDFDTLKWFKKLTRNPKFWYLLSEYGDKKSWNRFRDKFAKVDIDACYAKDYEELMDQSPTKKRKKNPKSRLKNSSDLGKGKSVMIIYPEGYQVKAINGTGTDEKDGVTGGCGESVEGDAEMVPGGGEQETDEKMTTMRRACGYWESKTKLKMTFDGWNLQT